MSSLSTDANAVDVLREQCAGDVFAPSDAAWDAARQPWHVLFDQQPAAVVYPESPRDVAAAIRVARRAGLRVAMQSTGHNAPAFGELGPDTLLVRTSRMNRVHIDEDRRVARVEAGALWQDVVPQASERGLLALHGSSPDVGVAGYSLGGGVGWLARSRGLQCNALTAVELVTADGEHVRADADHEPELFWALRGGGGNFGAVTALEFRLHPIERVYAGSLIWDWQDAQRVLHRWADWTLTLPESVMSVAHVRQLPDLDVIPEPVRGRDIVIVQAVYVGDEETGRDILRPLRELAPEMDTFEVVPPVGLMRLAGDPEGPTPCVVDGTLLHSLPPDAVDAFCALTGPGSGSVLIANEIRHMGGALARPATDGGALSHVNAAYMTVSVGMPFAPQELPEQARQVKGVTAALAPWASGSAYLNLTERPVDTAIAYGADTYRRLQDVRARVDPDGLLRANHEIAAAS
jgi:hypothetical protein